MAEVVEKLECKYCGKEFRKLSILSVHMCEKKRRWEQEKEPGVQFGFRAYLRFYESNQGSSKFKTYADFVGSQFYSAFVKFGQCIVQYRAVNPAAFIDWTIKNVKRIDHWTKDAVYDLYLTEYLKKEHPTDALSRSFEEMQRWADDNQKSFSDFFRGCSANKICQLIVDGRISPWVIFNSKGGIDFLSSLSEEQVSIIYRFIDTDIWEPKFKDYVADTELIKEACQLANL